MKISTALASILLAATPLFAAAPSTNPSDFTLASTSNIPGATLSPGSYTIRVLNRLSDRVILEIDSVSGAVHSTFIGIPNRAIAKPSSTGLVQWPTSTKGANYLKGWYFPGMSAVVEFVYPKAEALAIASSNPAKVPAVDPASEGKVADSTLSSKDMQLLTLWLLSVQQVQSNGQAPTVKAERYQPVSFAKQKPVIAALPHTASLVPLIWILALCSFIPAAVIRIVQWRRHTASPLPPSPLPDSLLRSAAGSTHVTSRPL
jgi:hypothetical protein